ncbi:MAG: heparinase II/III family protein [Prevotella sp.]|nr:heparinase II/III family protein [Prevotella sp.]
MGKLSWYLNRLKAMNAMEICWRLSQKHLQQQERHLFSAQNIPVTKECFYKEISDLHFNENALGINFGNSDFNLCTSIHLLGGYKYEDFKDKWHSGFQTNNEWALTFSYSLDYKQCDSIGDARTNWELNRHFQFALLAKAYYASGDSKYLDELHGFWSDWNEKNPFLHGISWTSVMELAIRSISWMYALAFLKKRGGVDEKLLYGLEIGILNMVAYISRHYSRFSSANNHLIVEATAMGLAGYAFGYSKWKSLAIKILTKELPKQNYVDGVNKELSLHYQTFVMEAYALIAHVVKCAGDVVPDTWLPFLEEMSKFLAHSTWRELTVCEFGDDDEGKILDLNGGDFLHFNYVLQLCSLVIGKRFHSFNDTNETINWLFSHDEIKKIKNLPLYNNSKSRCFAIGGNSFLRDVNDRILIGIDHAALGFGTLAAHGHADALSFQLFDNGTPIFIDPGTYIYHCYLNERNAFRRSDHHNTVMINGREQSEMLGAFLWGKKANTRLLDSSLNGKQDKIVAQTLGLSKVLHRRQFLFDKETGKLEITDCFEDQCDWVACFVIDPSLSLQINDNVVKIGNSWQLISECGKISVDDIDVSFRYGCKVPSKVLRVKGYGVYNKFEISYYK